MELTQAIAIAEEIRADMAPFCKRVEIAGSVRRRKANVHDIEIIAEPLFKPIRNLFQEPVLSASLLDDYLNSLMWQRIKGGNKYKQFALPQGINLDLFLVTPPAHWGVLFVIRTGPADFSKWIVTPRKYGGCLPSDCKVVDGAILRRGRVVDLPEEIDFLDLLGLGWVEPWERMPGVLSRRI